MVPFEKIKTDSIMGIIFCFTTQIKKIILEYAVSNSNEIRVK